MKRCVNVSEFIKVSASCTSPMFGPIRPQTLKRSPSNPPIVTPNSRLGTGSRHCSSGPRGIVFEDVYSNIKIFEGTYIDSLRHCCAVESSILILDDSF